MANTEKVDHLERAKAALAKAYDARHVDRVNAALLHEANVLAMIDIAESLRDLTKGRLG